MPLEGVGIAEQNAVEFIHVDEKSIFLVAKKYVEERVFALAAEILPVPIAALVFRTRAQEPPQEIMLLDHGREFPAVRQRFFILRQRVLRASADMKHPAEIVMRESEVAAIGEIGIDRRRALETGKSVVGSVQCRQGVTEQRLRQANVGTQGRCSLEDGQRVPKPALPGEQRAIAAQRIDVVGHLLDQRTIDFRGLVQAILAQ